MNEPAQAHVYRPNVAADAIAMTPDSLVGVGGWLKFFVFAKLYALPLFFVIQTLLASMGLHMLAGRHRGITLLVLSECVANAGLTLKWTRIAARLRDRSSLAVVETKTWLKISAGCAILDGVLAAFAGIRGEALMIGANNIVATLVGNALWYAYFSTSRRVAATYSHQRASGSVMRASLADR